LIVFIYGNSCRSILFVKYLLREENKKDIEKACKEGEYGKDEEAKYLEELQNLVSSANNELENIYSKKEKDILGE
jgi:ribosome recycling factor